MHFSSATQAETFRVNLHRHKRIQDNALRTLGLLEEGEETQSLLFSFDKETGIAKIAFGQKKHKRDYTFKIVEEAV